MKHLSKYARFLNSPFAPRCAKRHLGANTETSYYKVSMPARAMNPPLRLIKRDVFPAFRRKSPSYEACLPLFFGSISMALRRHRSCVDGFPLIFVTLLLILLVEKNNYSGNKATSDTSSFANAISASAVMTRTSTKNLASSFNPFKTRRKNLNDIMVTYSRNDFEVIEPTKIKRILFWNEAYGSKDYGIGFGKEGFQQLSCPITNCFTTDNRTLLPSADEFDAVIFHLR